MVYVAVTLVLLVAVVALFLRRTSTYYDQIFSEEHYAEVVHWLNSVLKLGAVDDPRIEDKTAFQTSGNCNLTFTRDIGEQDVVHIAISQAERPTTHAVCNRIAFLISEALELNNPATDFFYTQNHVHHLIFVKEAGSDWRTFDVSQVLSAMDSYQAPPFRFEHINELL